MQNETAIIKQSIKRDFLDNLARAPIGNDNQDFDRSVYGYAYNNKEYILEIVKDYDISIKELESALEKAIFNQVNEDKKIFVKGKNLGESIEQVANPRCLSYAVKKGHFDAMELLTIPYKNIDKNVFIDSHYEKGGKDLPNKLAFILLNPISKEDLFQKNDFLLSI